MEVNGTNMTMFIGKTDGFTLTIYDEDGAVVKLVTGDTLYFSVKEKLSDSSYILQKTVTTFNAAGAAVVSIDPADTSSLDADDYIYDVQVNYVSGDKLTLVEPSSFILKGVVTDE